MSDAVVDAAVDGAAVDGADVVNNPLQIDQPETTENFTAIVNKNNKSIQIDNKMYTIKEQKYVCDASNNVVSFLFNESILYDDKKKNIVNALKKEIELISPGLINKFFGKKGGFTRKNKNKFNT